RQSAVSKTESPGRLDQRLCCNGCEDAPLALGQDDLAQGGVLARTGHANAAGRLEDRAVVSADEAVFLVGQKVVGGEVQRPALMGADVEPGAWRSLAPGDDQPG